MRGGISSSLRLLSPHRQRETSEESHQLRPLKNRAAAVSSVAVLPHSAQTQTHTRAAPSRTAKHSSSTMTVGSSHSGHPQNRHGRPTSRSSARTCRTRGSDSTGVSISAADATTVSHISWPGSGSTSSWPIMSRAPRSSRRPLIASRRESCSRSRGILSVAHSHPVRRTPGWGLARLAPLQARRCSHCISSAPGVARAGAARHHGRTVRGAQSSRATGGELGESQSW